MRPITIGITKELAEIYDNVLDTFDGNEVAFAHAVARAISHFSDSAEDEQKEEIRGLLSQYFDEEGTEAPKELLEREVILDDETEQWLTYAMKNHKEKYADEHVAPESVFMTGVVTLSIMLDVVKKNPNARLSTLSSTLPISQIIRCRPQSYN